MASDHQSSRGTFVVIEGLDRSGKTTQVSRLVAALSAEGRKVQQMRFPDRTTVIGKMINDYLQSKSELEDHVIHLLFSANRWELASPMEKTLASGTSIICDRYCYSGMVYSAAKHNPSLSLEWAREPDVGLPRPDVVVFLDLDSKVAEERGGYGKEKYEKREFQERVRELFLRLKGPGSEGVGGEKREENGDLFYVDAGRTVEEVGTTVLEVVQQRIRAVEKGDLGNVVRKVSKWPVATQTIG